MTVDSCKPDGFVCEHGVETRCCWKFIAVPKDLIPAASQNPVELGLVGGERAHAVCGTGFGCRADKVYSQQTLAIAQYVAMGVDKPCCQCLAVAI